MPKGVTPKEITVVRRVFLKMALISAFFVKGVGRFYSLAPSFCLSLGAASLYGHF
jgi:hypothetical protein